MTERRSRRCAARPSRSRPSAALALAGLLLVALGGAPGAGAAGARTDGTPGEDAPVPERLGIYRDWAAYRFEEEGRPVCYAATDAVERRGTPPPADEGGGKASPPPRAWLLVTNDPGRGLRGGVSYVADRPLDEKAPVRVQVGRRRFTLQARGNRAWTVRDTDDLELVVAMKRGRTLLVGADLAGSGALLDTFSLLGFTRALSRITQACRLGAR